MLTNVIRYLHVVICIKLGQGISYSLS